LLFESEMFGHVKGSFSGALQDHKGHWARADKGTLFLDEIGDLSLTAQGKLLRALDSGEITPVGGVPIHPNVRIIAATNQDLEAMVEAGTFRQDLFHRLFGYVIRTPSLRSRSEDIAGLARSFWRTSEAKGALPLSDGVIAYLQTLQWPGNVRELKMRLEVLFEDFGSAAITVAHLDALFHSEGEMVGFGTRAGVRTFSAHLDLCLQHVLRAIDVVRKSQVPMRYPMEGKALDDMTLARIVIQTRHRVAELEELCHHPGLFHYTKTWEATRVCKRALREFADLLASSPAEALDLWKGGTEAATERATRLLFAALHKLERLARGGTARRKPGAERLIPDRHIRPSDG
jgi:DNA-binding NtrC family response regulator